MASVPVTVDTHGPHTVTWWEGDTRCTAQFTTYTDAMRYALKLRERSDALPRRSLVPIIVQATKEG